MVAVPTTRMSSRGQVVIPESIRIGCGFGEGTTFTVVAKGNAVMLQAIVAPPRDLFNELARESRAAAKAAGMRPSDITVAIREAHAERRARGGADSAKNPSARGRGSGASVSRV